MSLILSISLIISTGRSSGIDKLVVFFLDRLDFGFQLPLSISIFFLFILDVSRVTSGLAILVRAAIELTTVASVYIGSLED